MSPADTMFTHHWKRKRGAHKLQAESGHVTVTSVKDRYHVVVPFVPDVPPAMRAIGGFWRHRSGVWSVPLSNGAQLRVVLQHYYPLAQLPDGWR